jgi:hypothetical protein
MRGQCLAAVHWSPRSWFEAELEERTVSVARLAAGEIVLHVLHVLFGLSITLVFTAFLLVKGFASAAIRQHGTTFGTIGGRSGSYG